MTEHPEVSPEPMSGYGMLAEPSAETRSRLYRDATGGGANLQDVVEHTLLQGQQAGAEIDLLEGRSIDLSLLVPQLYEVFQSEAGIKGFDRGATLSPPGIPRVPHVHHARYDDLFSQMNTDTFDYASMTDSLRLIGYQIGFLFEIIRKTGVSLSQDDVPTDDGSYRFFVNGMSGSLFDRGQSETGISLADASLIDYHEDERIHDVGLKIYLAVKLGNTNGAGEIVDDPETLRVFKLYASGRTDNTYENTWSKINIRTTPLSDEMQHGLIARELGMQAYKANQTR